MEGLDQDVNQDGQNAQPFLDTSSEKNEQNISTQQEQGDVINTDQNKETDEKGVPWENRKAEYNRKIARAEEENVWLRKQIESLQQHAMKPQQIQQTNQEQKPQVSDDQLWEIIQNSPEHASLAKQELQRRMEDRVISKVKQEILPQAQIQNNKQMWEQQALQDFPELNDQTSQFFQIARKEYNLLNPNLPNIVYLAAENAAKKLGKKVRQVGDTRFDRLKNHQTGVSNQIASQQEQVPKFKMNEKEMYMTQTFDNNTNPKYKELVQKNFENIKKQKMQLGRRP